MPSIFIKKKLMTANASSDNTTTAATRPPARMTERASTPSPSAAIDIMVRKFAVMCVHHEYQPTESWKMDGVPQTRYPRKNWSSEVSRRPGVYKQPLDSRRHVPRFPGSVNREAWPVGGRFHPVRPSMA